MTLELLVLDGPYAIARLGPEEPTPIWATGGGFVSVTRTGDELSIICEEGAVPEGVRCERGWRALRVAGTLDFSAVGILARLAGPLAVAGVAICVVSTFDTDYLLVRASDLDRAVAALRAAGSSIREE
ncbi:MAG TPA: ACT domain-containing protein [Isosphaeraceae bacterium]|jgi:hypothetical protein|nr:ACT domain-containing protein [Isosphaeraceae bacterium]